MTFMAPQVPYAQPQQFASSLAPGAGFNTFGIQPAPAPAPSSGGGGGFSIFGWHPSVPNLGGITALKQFGSGLLGLAETPFKIASGEESPVDFATGMAKGIGGGLASVANTAGRIVGIPGTDISLEKPLQALEKPLFNGQAPPDFFEQSKREGPIAAFVNDALSVAAVAAPIAGGLGGAADAAEASAASLASDAEAASAAGDAAKAADLTQQAEAAAAKGAALRPQADLAHNFAHPFGWLMDQAAGLNNAASRQAYPAVSESAGSPSSAVDIASEEAKQKAVDIAKSTLDPGVAAAATMSRSPLEEAAAAAARDTSAVPTGPTNQDLINRDYPGAPTRTYYRGEPAGVEGAATGTNFHENPAYAKNFAGEGGTTYKVEVPVDAEGKPLVGEAAAKPDVGHTLPGDWADTAKPVEEPTQAPKPSTYGTPEERAAIDAEAAQARAEVPRESSVAEQQARKLQLPPPAWAQRLTEALPNSVNRVIGFMSEPIDRFRMKAVARDVTRIAEVAQRSTRNSAAMAESVNIAKDVLRMARDAGLTPTRLNIEHMVGEEVAARLDLTQIIDQAVKDTGNASPELKAALRDIARRGYKGIPDEIMNSLPPEQAAALNSALDSAAAAWGEQAMKVRQTLLASSHGAHGLEQAVLEDDNPTMTAAQVKVYKGAMRDLRREAFWRDRVGDQQARQEAEATRQNLVAEKASAEAAAARRWVGDTMAAAEQMRVGVPKGIEQLAQSVAEIKAGIANGGITYDVGMGRESAGMDSGFAVGIAPQFDVPMEEFIANGDQLISDALTNPQSIDGDSYGTNIWAGPDARFGAWVHTGADGRQMVAGDISMSTWGGVPLTQWQANVLGETFHQEATWDNAAGRQLDLSLAPSTQNLMAHYADMALDKNSGFYKFAEGLRTAAEGADRIDPEALDAQLQFFANWDYGRARANDAWQVGDFFNKVGVDFGKGAPGLPALLQSVMNIGSTTDGVNLALQTLDARQVSDALSWYYDSHDYIESTYRGKQFTHLDGTTRDAAEVFYDLIAVSSQMASPKQNLGRALMGLSNMEDFLTSRRNVFDHTKPGTSAAEKLLTRLDKLSAKARYDDKVVQKIVDGTGMVGTTKKLVFDVLSGRLKMDGTETADDIRRQPEFWGSKAKGLSDKNVPEGVSAMEYHGSQALAKMRSFRDNLANPHESTAVTLDSVMSRMYGFRGTDWALKGKYASYADDIRAAAKMLSEQSGREVKPHEIQALLWVYTKQELGRMDWGRLLAHHDVGQQALDSIEQHIAQGVPVDIRAFDPMADYFDEELGYSRTRMQEQMLFNSAQKQARKYGIESLHPEDQARLARGVDQSPHRSTVEIKPDRADVAAVTPESGTFQDRWHIPWDAKKLTAQEERFQNYLDVRNNIHAALREGDVAEARHQLTSWVVSQRRSIQGDVGGSFQQVGEETRNAATDSAAIAEQRLNKAKRVPAPRPWKQTFISPLAARFNRANGLDAPLPLDTTLEVVPERTTEVAAAVKQLAEREANGQLTPAEKAASEASYRVLQTWIDKQYAHMTQELGLHVEFVDPQHEYGLSSLGDDPQPNPALGHAELVQDVRQNNHLAVRGTALAGDGPNHFMAEFSPEDGLMYNDKLRAVHDFYGHAQAANDFSRHGENIAQMLHLQMFPEEAWPALFTEFRAQTAYLVDQGHFLDNQLTALLPDSMRAPDYMTRGNGDELHQRYQDTVRGATILPDDPSAKLGMRLFANAAIDTLAHEGGHLIRQLLPEEDMAWVEQHYPHITDTVLSEARRTAEEAFVSDMMLYMRETVRNGADAGPAADAFRRIAATMEEQVQSFQDTMQGRATAPDIRTFWDRQFNPEIVAPDKFTDPIAAQRILPGGVETKRFRWESEADFARRARQYGEARQAVETRRVKAQQYARREAQADAAARKAWAAVQAPTRAEKLANAYGARAAASLERLGAQLEDPSTGHVPPEWQPYWGAWKDLHAAALADTSGQIAQALGEIPETFSAALHYAAERGFVPTHVHDVTWERAQHFLFGHIQLVGKDVESSMRKTRTGSLSRAGLADRSLAALGAGIVDATKELYRSRLIDWVEKNYSQPLTQGAEIPAGWKPWDRTRQFIMEGTDQEGKYVAPGVTRIVPAGVDKAIRDMGKSYDNWAFHMITKVTSPWRTLILTMSPVWYLKHAIGNIVFASADGVRWNDWNRAYHQWRDNELPEDVRSIHSFAQSTTAEGASSLIPGGVRDSLKNEGVRAALHEVQKRAFKVNNAINEISRAAVYERALRSGATAEAALTRAYRALGDYGDMTPFERSAVRAVVPFYTFQKQVLKLVMRFPADHPVAAAALMQLGALHQEQMAEKLGGKLPDAYFGLADLGVLGVRNISFADPFRDASNLLTPAGLAGSFNPYLDVWLRQAYNAPESSATAKLGYGPTGKLETQQDLSAALGGLLSGLPQVRTAQGLAGVADSSGSSPSIAATAGQFLGVPKGYSPSKLQGIAQNVTRTTTGINAGWYPGFNAPRGTSAANTPEAFSRAAETAGLAGTAAGASATRSRTTSVPKVRKPRPARMRALHPHRPHAPRAPRVTQAKLTTARISTKHVKAIRKLI